MVSVTLHKLDRPSRSCAVCATDWPCRTRRRQLVAEYAHDPIALRVFMFALAIDALDELDLSPEALYERFLAWVDVSAMTGGESRQAQRERVEHRQFTGRARPRYP
jgi:hypothetical protein